MESPTFPLSPFNKLQALLCHGKETTRSRPDACYEDATSLDIFSPRSTEGMRWTALASLVNGHSILFTRRIAKNLAPTCDSTIFSSPSFGYMNLYEPAIMCEIDVRLNANRSSFFTGSVPEGHSILGFPKSVLKQPPKCPKIYVYLWFSRFQVNRRQRQIFLIWISEISFCEKFIMNEPMNLSNKKLRFYDHSV